MPAVRTVSSFRRRVSRSLSRIFGFTRSPSPEDYYTGVSWSEAQSIDSNNADEEMDDAVSVTGLSFSFPTLPLSGDPAASCPPDRPFSSQTSTMSLLSAHTDHLPYPESFGSSGLVSTPPSSLPSSYFASPQSSILSTHSSLPSSNITAQVPVASSQLPTPRESWSVGSSPLSSAPSSPASSAPPCNRSFTPPPAPSSPHLASPPSQLACDSWSVASSPLSSAPSSPASSPPPCGRSPTPPPAPSSLHFASPPSQLEGSLKNRRRLPPRKRKEGYIPRPRNAFIIFRSNVYQEFGADGGPHQATLSKLAGQRWRELSQESRDRFKEEAEREKEFHKVAYPDYSYQPAIRRGGNKKTKAIRKAKEANV